MAQNIPRGTPARILVLLTLLTGLVAVSAWRDALRRDINTWISHPTALGDPGLLMPGQLPALLESDGKTFTLSQGGPVLHRRDDRMFRVTTWAGASLPFSLFTSRETLASETDPKLYGRQSPHQYVRLRARLEPPDAAGRQLPPKAIPVEPLGPAPRAIPVEDSESDFPFEAPSKGTL